MKLILNYFKTFTKVIFSEKLPFLYSVFFPAVLFLINNFSRLGQTMPFSQLLLQTANYVGYIIVLVAINGIGIQLINFRESGFLKTYIMISGGDKKYAVFGLILSEMLFGYVSTLLFGLVLSIFNLKSIILILIFYTITYVIAAIPVFLLTVILSVIATRLNTISTVANIVLFGMLWLSAARTDTHNLFGELLYGLNPVDYVSQVLITGSNLLQNVNVNTLQQLLIVVILFVIFSTIGLLAIPKVRLNSLNMRN